MNSEYGGFRRTRGVRARNRADCDGSLAACRGWRPERAVLTTPCLRMTQQFHSQLGREPARVHTRCARAAKGPCYLCFARSRRSRGPPRCSCTSVPCPKIPMSRDARRELLDALRYVTIDVLDSGRTAGSRPSSSAPVGARWRCGCRGGAWFSGGSPRRSWRSTSATSAADRRRRPRPMDRPAPRRNAV